MGIRLLQRQNKLLISMIVRSHLILAVVDFLGPKPF